CGCLRCVCEYARRQHPNSERKSPHRFGFDFGQFQYHSHQPAGRSISKHDLDIEPIYFGSGMNSLATVTSNSVQFLAAGSTATISARLGGIDIVMLSVQSNKLDYSVFAAPEVKTFHDLKGKIVTGTRSG